MKIIIIIIGLLLISSIAVAANNVEVHINYPADTVFIGSYNQLEIWIENDFDIIGLALGFEFSSYSGTISWNMNYGDFPPANVENDARGAIDFNYLALGLEDSYLPDSILIGGAAIPPFEGLPTGNLRKCYTLHFYIPEGTPEQDFCIDNIFVPPAGEWVFDNGSQAIAPDYHGCQNSSPGDPDCPPICYPVRITTRVCGDANEDGHANLSDLVTILRFIFHEYLIFSPWVISDVDCDGRFNIGDIVYMTNYVFYGGPLPCSDCP
ncbi:MAG: hypothetical protein GWN00_24370 [Aliifodinibius sp.]|nr:hypothetical protein [candidate division Zixibacteria bacterium]NIT59240.1 hypothetical protein [Fodinibius sp.]NIW40501.1 hypothetical protein [candidate division Zixibacteria bacterium]NIX57824.1 hypothetical protein [candidate division Zixibacteria bacterium]NIY27823.1 hypothetical protein [Fodinibius sp.]